MFFSKKLKKIVLTCQRLLRGRWPLFPSRLVFSQCRWTATSPPSPDHHNVDHGTAVHHDHGGNSQDVTSGSQSLTSTLELFFSSMSYLNIASKTCDLAAKIALWHWKSRPPQCKTASANCKESSVKELIQVIIHLAIERRTSRVHLWVFKKGTKVVT